MTLSLKNKLQTINISRFNLVLLGTFVLLNAILLGLSIGLYTYRYSMEFGKANVLQLIILLAISLVVFYFSYEHITKKKPSILLLIGFILLAGVTIFNMSGLGYMVERLSDRATFSVGSVQIIMLATLFFSLLLARFDFPLIDSKEKLFIVIEDHFIKNIGIYLALFFVMALIGVINGSFSHIAIMVIFFINLYISKVLLSNFRR